MSTSTINTVNKISGPKRNNGSLDMRYKVNRTTVAQQPQQSINWTYRLNINNSITFNDGTRDIQTLTLHTQSSNISCGVLQCYGISSIANCSMVPRQIFIEGIRALLTQIKGTRWGYLIMSTNRNEFVHSVMSAVCPITTPYVRNPNTGRQIACFIF